jgi:hypothetical protein
MKAQACRCVATRELPIDWIDSYVKFFGMVAVLTGDALQDGTAGAGGERGGGDGAVRAAEQTLHPSGHEVHWGGQHNPVRIFLCRVEGIFRSIIRGD